MLKVLDLFSGIGGFSLGLESTGHFETVAFCEKDQFCQKVLKKHWSNIPIIGDIKDVKGSEFKADVITGGVPCQPISIAGKQKGKDDDRFLFPEMLRVVKEVKPRWTIIENVQNLINISNGTILREIIEGLETEGFEVQCFSISASSSQGAWHKRERVWIIANSKSKWSRECRELDKKKRLEESKSTQSDCICSDVPNSECNEHQHTPTRQSRTGEVWGFYSEKEKQTSHDLWSKTTRCNAPLGQKTWWQTESELCGVPDGVSYELDKDRANRIKALGNSIVPQIVRELGLAIIEAENDR